MGPARLLALLVLAYLLGSVPTGLWLGKLVAGVDVRTVGSRRTGATNVTRTLGLGAGIAVGAVDVAKGFTAVALVAFLAGNPAAGALGGIAAIVGHNWPVFAGFRGGRGVATAGGAFLAICPPAFVCSMLCMAVAIAVTRYVSLGSIVAAVTGAIAATVAWRLHVAGDAALLLAVPGSVLIVVRHADNIDRLVHGRERRLGQRASTPAPPLSAPT